MPKHHICIYDDIQIKYKCNTRPITIDRVAIAIYYRSIIAAPPLYLTALSSVCKNHAAKPPNIVQPIQVKPLTETEF